MGGAQSVKRRIGVIKRGIVQLGPVHPGRISKQYNICGTPGCQCKDPKRPRKHGPYHYLSYTFRGKGRTVSIPKEAVAEIVRRNKRYERLRELVADLVEANVALTRQEVLGRGPLK
jgi:hypothetical protein